MLACTTQDFETPAKVYRIKLQNIGKSNYSYKVVANFYYQKGKKLVKIPVKGLPSSNNPAVLHPGNPGIILAQSKKFVKGVSFYVLPVSPSSTTVKLTLIVGYLDNHGFKKSKIVDKKKGKGVKFVRYGKYY
jgi:hypothetical protein